MPRKWLRDCGLSTTQSILGLHSPETAHNWWPQALLAFPRILHLSIRCRGGVFPDPQLWSMSALLVVDALICDLGDPYSPAVGPFGLRLRRQEAFVGDRLP